MSQEDSNLALDQIAQIRELISQISSRPLSEHCEQFDLVHSQLNTALSQIDGL
jgi:hypothetical protein